MNKELPGVALGFIKKPIAWVLVLLAVFGFVVWNGYEATKRIRNLFH